MKSKTLYLCGGINGLSDSDCRDWREAAKQELSDLYTILDPMRRDYRGREAECVDEIVEGDFADLNQSDLILVNAMKPSWGTAMELRYFAGELQRRAVVVCDSDKPSPWLVKHAWKLVRSFDEAFQLLTRIA